MENINVKTQEEIEKNKKGFYDVKPLRKNAKVLDLNNLGETILNFGSITKQSLIRLFSNDLTYYLNQMEKNEELQAKRITSLNNQGGDKVYFYNEFTKEEQLKSELISYFTYYLKENDIMYGKLSVNPLNKVMSVPFIIEKEDGILKIETEVYTLQSYELSTFDFGQNFDKMPVFVVDEVYSLEQIKLKPINCIVILVDNTGRNTEVRGIYKEVDKENNTGSATVLTADNINKPESKYKSQIALKNTIDSFKKPYLEAERRSKDVKSRINSKKSL